MMASPDDRVDSQSSKEVTAVQPPPSKDLHGESSTSQSLQDGSVSLTSTPTRNLPNIRYTSRSVSNSRPKSRSPSPNTLQKASDLLGQRQDGRSSHNSHGSRSSSKSGQSAQSRCTTKDQTELPNCCVR